MGQQIINNGETGAVVRAKLNDNFTELYTGKDSVTVNTFADLPAPATVTGQKYWVLTSTGVYLINRRNAGSYYSDGSVWTWLGNNPSTADQIGNVPAGGIAATDVQAALNELDTDKLNVGAAAASATRLTTGRTIAITGDLVYTSPAFDGTGNVTASGTISNDAVTFAKMQNSSAASILVGRGAGAGAGDFQEITLGTNLSMSGTTLNATSGGGSSPDSRAPLLITDFSHTNAVQNDFTVAIIGTGASFTTAPAASALGPNHPGVHLWRCGTTTNSGVQCFTAQDRFRIGGGEQWDVNFRIVSSFSGTTFRSGAGDQITSTAFIDGVWLELSGSGAMVGKTRSNSTETASATIATLSVDTWYHGRITVNSGATSVTFELFDDAGTSLGSQAITTNIPTAAARELGWGSIVTNTATVATDLLLIDRQKLTNPGRTVQRGAA